MRVARRAEAIKERGIRHPPAGPSARPQQNPAELKAEIQIVGHPPHRFENCQRGPVEMPALDVQASQ